MGGHHSNVQQRAGTFRLWNSCWLTTLTSMQPPVEERLLSWWQPPGITETSSSSYSLTARTSTPPLSSASRRNALQLYKASLRSCSSSPPRPQAPLSALPSITPTTLAHLRVPSIRSERHVRGWTPHCVIVYKKIFFFLRCSVWNESRFFIKPVPV